MKTYAGSVSIVNNNNLERRIFTTLLLGFAFFTAIYLLLLGNMIFNIIERKTAETEIRNLSSSVSGLELSYLSLSKNINLDMAGSLGFSETSQKKFTSRKALGSLKLASSNDL